MFLYMHTCVDMHACAELPRDIREKLVSWNHTQEYETAGYQDYASRLGGGQYEKVWDLGELLCLLSTPATAALTP